MLLPHLVLQAHEVVAVIITKRRLGGVTSDWISRVSIGKTLDRECWSCKHIYVITGIN